MHVPGSFVLVNLQDDAGIGGRVVCRSVEQEKVRSHLRDREGKVIDQQAHFHLRGMPAVSRGRKHGS